MADVICADVEKDDIRFVRLEPAICINALFDLRDGPAGMTLIVRIGYGLDTAALRSHEVNDVPVVGEEIPESVTITAVASIGSTEGD